MRVVLDANVLIAAVGFGGVCRAVLEVCIDSHRLVLSQHILGEVRQHLQDKFRHSAAMADEAVSLLSEAAEIVVPVPMPSDACRDADDLPVLGTVLAGNADCLVTGDGDLLALDTIDGRPILSPAEFWRRLK